MVLTVTREDDLILTRYRDTLNQLIHFQNSTDSSYLPRSTDFNTDVTAYFLRFMEH
jgi:hypothetical protein